MVKNVGLLLVLLIVMFVAGCSQPSEQNTEEEGLPVLIILLCNPEFDIEPCQDVELDRPDEIRMIVEAIHKAEQLPGNLNYVAQYRMTITSADGVITRYDLSLGMDSKMQGLLVNHDDTTTGYSLSVEDSNILRRLIQRRID